MQLRNTQHTLPALVILSFLGYAVTANAQSVPAPEVTGAAVFDGRTLAGWEGDESTWRVQDGVITGGSLTERVARNEFLASTRDYTNFLLRFEIKLTGTEGFINSGFQIRSQRVPNSHEMSGYQCDFGEPNWYGAIYDEARRNKVMSASDMAALRPVIKRDDWNEYIIRADGPRITTWLNGVRATDFLEPDTTMANYDWGKFGIQVHGGGKALVQVRQLVVQELPPTPAEQQFLGAPTPSQPAKSSPLTPEEELAMFTLPPGFEIELVVSEDIAAGFGKFVAMDWDLHGNLWTMTALEYPVDANESPEVARELYASKAKDKVLVYERDPSSPTGYARTPRVFAEGLAIPLGILPYKNGVYVQHGSDIVFLSDTDGDGRADRRDVILSGFGIQDSHLFPHQFTRAPGNWLWMAQGAFNYGKVRTTRGEEVQFDQTRMAKFSYDGSAFDITSQGPCNIWGLALTAEGEVWIQEANDFGYPAMPFHEYANYPGCSEAQWKSYAPEFPGTAPDFRMGGTGLSGLALSDPTGWPAAYADVLYVANPIVRRIQAIKPHRTGSGFQLQRLPDLVASGDEWFRPVALRLGPDGWLYFVDWYNQIISHNEVPRNHPERDKQRGRIWRVKPKEMKPLAVPDFMRLSGEELLARLGGANTPQSHLAWQAITDRQMRELTPRLQSIARDNSQSAGRRIASLWALEGLDEAERVQTGAAWFELLEPLLQDPNRNVRREALRILGTRPLSVAGASRAWGRLFDALDPLAEESDPQVRAELIKTVIRLRNFLLASSDGRTASLLEERAMPLLLRMARPALAEPTAKSTHSGKLIKVGEAYEREFERYLIRYLLERQPLLVGEFLDSATARSFPAEHRLLFALALEPEAAARRVAQLLPELDRAPGEEELLCLARNPQAAGVGEALGQVLRRSATRRTAVESLLKIRTRLEAGPLAPSLTDTARELLTSGDKADAELGARLAGAFQLAAVEPELTQVLEHGVSRLHQTAAGEPSLGAESLAALRALRELKSEAVELFARLAQRSTPVVQELAVSALAASRSERGPEWLVQLVPKLPAAPRRAAVAALAGTKSGAAAFVRGLRRGDLDRDELDAVTLDKLHTLLGDDPDLKALVQSLAGFFRPALRLNGSAEAWADTDITLDGPFTVETWIKLDAGIDNRDGILGAPGMLDMNFHAGQFRVWAGSQIGDAIIVTKKMAPEVWTHIAVTRDADSRLRVYLNGELDTDQGKILTNTFEGCRLGWTSPAQGTHGWLTEFRVWHRARTTAEIRSDFDRSYVGEPRPAGLVHLYSGEDWGKLKKGAQVTGTMDFPALLTAAEAKAFQEKFDTFRALATKPGDIEGGRSTFQMACASCHAVGGQGGQIGPVLDGAGALGIEALLRNLLTPNVAVEAGYRVFRVELADGEVMDGIRVSEDPEAIVLRQPNQPDTRIAQKDVRRAGFTKMSMMPEGLLETLPPQDVSNLFAFLRTLK
ncbi:MAG: DUF1080 domain-containing protein [Verrucomicrobiae bacterium]|nr:DUF1080 domain-containing protein [Verrucomicrobiae bacterium]